MKLTTVLILFSLAVHGQRNVRNPYSERMDSLAWSRLGKSLRMPPKRTWDVLYYRVGDVKFSASTRINSGDKKDLREIDANTSTFENYLTVVMTDLRAKIYLNRRISVVPKIVLTALNLPTYQYAMGLYWKFT